MTTINNNFFQALSLDICILQVLLKRNRRSHGRAIYYRRMAMVLQATQRCGLLETGERLERLERNAIEYCQIQKRKRMRHEDQWDSRKPRTDEQIILQQDYETLQRLGIESFSELLSRIQYASDPLFLEVSRGFFLPFCTVALSALARVRVLILRIGRHLLSKLQQLISSDESLRNILPYSKEKVETTMAKYLEAETSVPLNDGTVKVGMVSKKERRPILVKSLGYNLSKSAIAAKEKSMPSTKTLKDGNDADDDGDDGIESTSYGDSPLKTSPATIPHVPSSSHTQNTEFENGEDNDDNDGSDGDGDDIGESVTFTDSAMPTKSVSDRTYGSSMTFPKTDVIDRNMELLASFKSKNRTTDRANQDKKSMKRKESNPSKLNAEKTPKKKKKKKSKGDFFDALFD